MRRGHIPFRGEVRPKLIGQPSPPRPTEEADTFLFWFLWIVVGLVIAYFAITRLAQANPDGLFVFVIYAMFALVAFFGTRDLKNIRMLTPDRDDEKEPEQDGPSVAEDYFAQLDWMHTHRRGRHHPSHWDAPEPPWRYHRVGLQGYGAGAARGCVEVLGIFILALSVIAATVWLSMLLGTNSPILIAILVVASVAGVGTIFSRK